MGLLYVVSFIDRANVAFAALTMNKDLGFSPTVFGFGTGIFFIGYMLCLVPSNLILERMGARRWVFCIMAVWGTLSAAGALASNPLSFYLLRFFLGVAEAGFFPGMLLYLTYWFPRPYRARFTANFMAAIPLSFAIGGPLASIVLQMDRIAGLSGWQWLFIVEGTPAILLAFLVLKLLPDGPMHAPWLSHEEKETIAARLAADQGSKHGEVWPVFRDPHVLMLGFAYIGLYAAIYGVTLWLPQIVQGMGFSNLATGFVVALPFAVSVLAMVLVGRSSDVHGERVRHVVAPLGFAALCLFMASLGSLDLVVLFALSGAMIAIYGCFGPFFCLPSLFLSGTAAAVGIAFINAIANLGAFLGPYLIGVLNERTGNYSLSMAVLGGGLVISALIIVALGQAIAPSAQRVATESKGHA